MSHVAVYVRRIDVGDCGVDVCEEHWIVLCLLVYNCSICRGNKTNLFAAIVVENGTRGFGIGGPFDGSALVTLAMSMFFLLRRRYHSQHGLVDAVRH